MWLIQTKDKSSHTQIMFKLVKFDIDVYLKETLRFQAQTKICFICFNFSRRYKEFKRNIKAQILKLFLIALICHSGMKN